jgi:DNA-binding transcriptional LysR family regulator
VVQPFFRFGVRLAASSGYVARHGLPQSESDLAGHSFVWRDNFAARAPFALWIRDHVPAAQMTFRSDDTAAILDAVVAGAGIGFVFDWEFKSRPDLVEAWPMQPDWAAPMWLVTHVDLHRTAKVQAFLSFLKERAKGWSC